MGFTFGWKCYTVYRKYFDTNKFWKCKKYFDEFNTQVWRSVWCGTVFEFVINKSTASFNRNWRGDQAFDTKSWKITRQTFFETFFALALFITSHEVFNNSSNLVNNLLWRCTLKSTVDSSFALMHFKTFMFGFVF